MRSPAGHDPRPDERVLHSGRWRVIAVLAAVLGLSGADLATVSATTDQLERVFGIGNTQVGVLVSAVSLVGALGTLPAGVLTDRSRRTRLLAVSILVWSAALVASGAATSYWWLVAARLVLGVAIATTGPAVSSLVGDYFPTGGRGRVYSLILGGELAGTGIGFVVAGEISSILPWRFAFWWLAVPELLLAYLVARLPEPERGAAAAAEPDRAAARGTTARPDPRLVLHSDPADRSVWWAVRYVLRVRTNLVIIVASALGYFFFSGLRTFAILFVMRHYGLAKPVASSLVLVLGVGAVLGALAGGRISDHAVRRGHILARVVVPAVCLFAVVPVFAPALLTTTVAVALPLLTLGAASLGAANPPMDAARLDIMHPRLWGRAEAVRTVLRTLAESAGPVLFGFLSEHVLHGLEPTFLVFLVPLLLAGVLVLPALRTYPRDVATAAAARIDPDPAGRPDVRPHASRPQR